MTKREFELMALKEEEPIPQTLYEKIEAFYMADDAYHKEFGGYRESKQDFVRRVYGGKVNTREMILQKTIEEATRELTYYANPHKGEREERSLCTR